MIAKVILTLLALNCWAQTPTAETASPVSTDPAVEANLPEGEAAPLQEIETPPLVTDIIEKFIYSGAGKRDPFKPFMVTRPVELSTTVQGPSLPLQKFSLDQLQLVGVIWGGPKPMAMLIDTTKKVYYVKENDKIGNNNGYVAKIREGEIVVIEMLLDENGRANYVTRIMKINKNINQ